MTASAPMPSVWSLTHAATSTVGGVDDLADVEAAREGGAHRVHLGDEDARSGGGRVERRESTDRARPGDEHGVAGADAGDVDAVRRDGARLDEGALQVADFVGQHAHVAAPARRRARRCRPSRS